MTITTRVLHGVGAGGRGKSVLHMSMSLDGFVTRPDDGPDDGLGIGFDRLPERPGQPIAELPRFNPPGLSGQVFAGLEIHLVPVLLGEGRRLFDDDRIELETMRVLGVPGVTHLQPRVSAGATR